MSSKQILFALWDGGGTVPPELAIARALIARGHDVRVMGDRSLAPEVAAIGARHVPWTTAPQRTTRKPDDDFLRDWEIESPLKLFATVRDRFLCGPAGRFADDVAAELRARPAAVLVASQMLLGAQIAAEAQGVPVILLCPNIYGLPGTGQPPLGLGLTPSSGLLGRLRDRAVGTLMERAFDGGLSAINAAREAHGLAPLAHTLDQVRSQPTLLLTDRAFDFPGALPDNVRHAGVQLDDPSWTERWQPPPGDAPLVLVAMSSTYQAQLPELCRVAEALGRLPVRGVLTAGPSLDPSAIAAPSNVQVCASAPHSEVLRHAAAVVTHGGHGTVVKALAADVPLLVLPMGRDQADNAARVVWRGAGLALKRTASTTAIAAALTRLLGEPAFRARAAEIGQALRLGAGPQIAVDVIEQRASAPSIKQCA